MLCPSCDQENPGFANFCQYCGFQFRDPPVDLVKGREEAVRPENTLAREEVSGTPAPAAWSPGDSGAMKMSAPRQGDDGLTAAGYYEKGVELFTSRDFEAALAVLTLATSLDPSMDRAFNARGVCLARLGRMDEAVSSYENALAIDPENEKYRKNLAVTRMKRGMAQAASRHGHGTSPVTPDTDGGAEAGWPMEAPGPELPPPPATDGPAGGTAVRTEPSGEGGPVMFPAPRVVTGPGATATASPGGLRARVTVEQPAPVTQIPRVSWSGPRNGPYDAPYYYSGAWVRWVAYFVDTLIIVGVSIAVMLPVVFLAGIFMQNIFVLAGLFLAISTIYILYFTLLECSPKQATFGKRLFRLFVTGNEGGRLTFPRSFARNFLKIFFTAGLLQVINGCVIWASPQGKGVHDYLAGTLVLTPDPTGKGYVPGGPRETSATRVAIAVLIVLCVVAVIVATVFAARLL